MLEILVAANVVKVEGSMQRGCFLQDARQSVIPLFVTVLFDHLSETSNFVLRFPYKRLHLRGRKMTYKHNYRGRCTVSRFIDAPLGFFLCPG